MEYYLKPLDELASPDTEGRDWVVGVVVGGTGVDGGCQLVRGTVKQKSRVRSNCSDGDVQKMYTLPVVTYLSSVKHTHGDNLLLVELIHNKKLHSQGVHR